MAVTIQLKDFAAKASPVPADIIYSANSADSFNEVQITIADLIAAYPGLASIGSLTTLANEMIYTTDVDTYAVTAITAFGRSVVALSAAPTAPAASSLAGWDANSNLSANAIIEGFATTATAAGTTTLTVASKQIQEFTGSTTQTVVMPVASTLVAGQSFDIINNSSSNLTVNSSGGNLILTMAANTSATVVCVLNSGTTAASWNASYFFDSGAGVLSITGTANQVTASSSTGNVILSLPQDIETTSAPTFSNLTLTGSSILDVNGNVNLSFAHVASSVNYLQITNSIAANQPLISALGSDSNISIVLKPKADAGVALQTSAVSATPFQIYSGTTSQHLTNFIFANTPNTRNVTFPDASGTVLLTTSVVAPTIQKFTSGSGTYTTPTSPAPLYIRVVAVGGGAGGGGSGTSPGAPGSGGNTTFGTTLIVANGGTTGSQGAGGTVSLGAAVGIAVPGGQGTAPGALANSNGGTGAETTFGGGGTGGQNGFGGGTAATNSGAGGGGAGGGGAFGGGFGGASGGYVDGIITSPSATYSYAVGAAGSGGTLGVGGSAGGNGAAGQIVVYEFYQ